jgi:putative methionine-R-sulfoxide reductase with GAF domain
MSAAAFTSWMTQGFELWPGGLPEERRSEYEWLVARTAAAWTDGPELLRAIPALIRERFGARGFAWNGIYALAAPRTLELFAAAGPPVCHELERSGGAGSSGMCWDCILMGQTLIAADVSRWPGYVSCDAESGLATAAGICCPIRDAGQRPIAVWDLDCTRPLAAEDGVFFDRFFATLSALLELPRDALGRRGR